MRLSWRRVIAAVAGILLVAAVVVVSGIVPNRASAGHGTVTRWVLEFATARSVATHSFGITAPDLEDPTMVLRGAGHYELGCVTCHGGPGRTRSGIALAMTPEPPLLTEASDLWEPEELYYIVRHGMKFTGMPAWPAVDRGDEVWSMVAFLEVLPELDEEAYRELAFGAAGMPAIDLGSPPAQATDSMSAASERIEGPPEIVLESCGRCHGTDGRGRGLGAFPTLAGQRAGYLSSALEQFADGTRPSGTMSPVALDLDPDQRDAVARYYESRADATSGLRTASDAPEVLERLGLREVQLGEGPPPGFDPESENEEGTPTPTTRGEQIARSGIPELKVPACAPCHGSTGAPAPVNPEYPLLAGQHERYLVEQLHLYRSRTRGGSELTRIMHAAIRQMEDAEILDVAAYYASSGDEP